MELARRELLALARRLQLRSRRRVPIGVLGRFRGAFRGTGIEFADLKEYHPGDDFRAIDWNVTARQGRPFQKRFVEERQRTVFFVLDSSASMRTGLHSTPWQRCAEVLLVVGLAAVESGDRVGAVIAGSDGPDGASLVFRPMSGPRAVWPILDAALKEPAAPSRSRLEPVLTRCRGFLRRHSVLLVLSDFRWPLAEPVWRQASRYFDATALCVREPLSRLYLAGGRVDLLDPVRGRRLECDLSDARVREELKRADRAEREALRGSLARSGASFLELSTEEPLFPALRRWFGRRERRRGR